jgi:flagellar basal-body rod protein FlgC
MGDGMSISASGMQAASRWFSTTASNIVTQNADGGLAPSDQAPSAQAPSDQGNNGAAGALQTSRLAYDPQAPYANMQGMITPPNSDLVTEMVHLREAQNSFRANLAAFKTSSHMFKALLDATA